MGLTSWKGENVRKTDVAIAKNYLNTEELDALNRIVSMYLDYAEDQARRHKQMFMREWRNKLDSFLLFNERTILTHAGKISHELAAARAGDEYEKYNLNRIAEKDQSTGDFDQMAKTLENTQKETLLQNETDNESIDE